MKRVVPLKAVHVSPRVERALRRDNIARAIAAELGLGPAEQLELVLVSPPTATRSGRAPCAGCGRWNYHLAGCPRRSSRP